MYLMQAKSISSNLIVTWESAFPDWTGSGAPESVTNVVLNVQYNTITDTPNLEQVLSTGNDSNGLSMTISSDLNVTGDFTLLGRLINAMPINAQSGVSYDPIITDVNKLVTLSNISNVTVTINPDVFSPGQVITFAQLNIGQVSFAGSGGVVINSSSPDLTTRTIYSVATLTCIAANTFILSGDVRSTRFVADETAGRSLINNATNNTANRVYIAQWEAPSDFTLTQLGVSTITSWGAANAIMGIYSHATGNMLSQTASYTNTVTGIFHRNLLTPVRVFGGSLYWLAFKLDAATGSVGAFTSIATSGTAAFGTYATAGLPASMSALTTGATTIPYFSLVGLEV